MQRVKAINAVENNQQYGLVIYPAKNNEKINSFFYPVKPCKMADIRNKGLYVRTKTDYGSPADKPFYYRYYFNLVVIAEVVIAKVIIMDAGAIVIKCL